MLCCCQTHCTFMSNFLCYSFFYFFNNYCQGEEIFLDMFEDEYRSMTVSLSFARFFFSWLKSITLTGTVRLCTCML